MNQATACDPGGQINNSAGYKFRYRIDKPKSKRVLTRMIFMLPHFSLFLLYVWIAVSMIPG